MKPSPTLSRFLSLACVFLPFLVSTVCVTAAEPPRKPRVFFLIGESEYQTEITLPAFAKAELEPLGIQSTFSIQTDEASDSFPGLETLPSADLLFVSVRRKRPPEDQMELIRTFIAAGKPVVGIRTASHAFGKRKGEAEGSWENFDKEILGASYTGHYGLGTTSQVKPYEEALRHPVLAGLDASEFRTTSHLYKCALVSATVVPLLQAKLESGPEIEPVAWVNTRDKQRIFYTSLGGKDDFTLPQFRKLLANGISWALGLPVSPESAPSSPPPPAQP